MSEEAIPMAREMLRTEMESACDRLSECNVRLNNHCNEFEALLDDPEGNRSQIRQAQTRVRATGMQGMSLTTAYLAALNQYMKSLDDEGN